MSGTAIADAAGLGTIEIKAMRDHGYSKEFAVGVTAASATLGPIIPPSLPFVIYGMVANVSIGQLFLAGIVPGLVMTVLMMLTVAYYAHKNNWGADIKFLWSRVGKATLELAVVIAFPLVIWLAVKLGVNPVVATVVAMVALFAADWKFKFEAVLPIMTPVLLIGGMTTGIFTPTEGAVAASIWALFLGLVWYRTLTFKMLIKVSMETIETTATVLFIVAAASIFGWLLTATRVTDMVTAWVLGFTHSPWVFLLLVNLLLLFVGCFLEPTAAILIAVPVLMPAVLQLGIDPVHFGLVVVLNLMIGLLHPPMGMVLFVLARVARMSLERTTMAILPWLVPLLCSLILITYVPDDLAVAADAVLPLGAIARCARDRTRRDPAGRPAAEGRAHRRDPVVRHAGDADRADHLRRRRAGRRLHVHDRHRRLVGRRAAARPSRAAAHRPRRGGDRGDLEGPLLPHACDRGRRDHEPGARGDRHGAVGPAAAGAPALPLWKMAGGAQRQVPVYTTEGGWLHHSRAAAGRRGAGGEGAGFQGAKIKVGKPSIAEDVARLSRGARGGRATLRADGRREPGVHRGRGVPARPRATRDLMLGWFEEPLPAEDLGGHVELAAKATMPIAVGESLITRRISASISSAAPARSSRSIARASAASRRGSRSRIWRRRSTSPVCPHFLMELHVSLSAAVPNGAWVEYIPQLDAITTSRMAMRDGYAIPPGAPGLGIDWDFAAIDRLAVARATVRR